MWIDDFIEACRCNPTITWLLFHDGKPPANCAANVHIESMTLLEFEELASARLEISCAAIKGCKVCDFRPTFGILFREALRAFEFWGHCDLDVVWGRIRAFLTEPLLATYHVVSGDPRRLCGPFTIFRNCDFINNLFRRAAYVEILQDRAHRSFDEQGFDRVVKAAAAAGELKLLMTNAQGIERHSGDSSIGANCIWQRGRLFSLAPRREVMFYHFRESKRWPCAITWRSLESRGISS